MSAILWNNKKTIATLRRLLAPCTCHVVVQDRASSSPNTMFFAAHQPYLMPHVVVLVEAQGITWVSPEQLWTAHPARMQDIGRDVEPQPGSDGFPVVLVRMHLGGLALPLLSIEDTVRAVFEFEAQQRPVNGAVRLTMRATQYVPTYLFEPVGEFDMEKAYDRCFDFLADKARPDPVVVMLALLSLVREKASDEHIKEFAAWLVNAAHRWPAWTDHRVGSVVLLDCAMFSMFHLVSEPLTASANSAVSAATFKDRVVWRTTHIAGPLLTINATKLHTICEQQWPGQPTTSMVACEFTRLFGRIPMRREEFGLVNGYTVLRDLNVMAKIAISDAVRITTDHIQQYMEHIQKARIRNPEQWEQLEDPIVGWPGLTAFDMLTPVIPKLASHTLQRLTNLPPEKLPVCLKDMFRLTRGKKPVATDQTRRTLGALAQQTSTAKVTVKALFARLPPHQLTPLLRLSQTNYGAGRLQCYSVRTLFKCDGCMFTDQHKYPSVLAHPVVQQASEDPTTPMALASTNEDTESKEDTESREDVPMDTSE